MRLKRLFLRNFATYKTVELRYDRFRYPLFVSGETGAGKTSILIDALSSALFGRAYGERREGSLKYAARMGGPSEIELEFEIGGETYVINRKVDRISGHRATLTKVRKDGTRVAIASTIKEVERHVKRLIGLDMEDFLHTIAVRQGEVSSLIDPNLMPKRRTELFQRIFKLEFDKYKDRAKKLRQAKESEISSLKLEIGHLEREIAREDELRSELKELVSKLEEHEKERPCLEAEKRKVEDEIRRLREEIEILRSLMRIGELKREEKRRKKELEELSNEMNTLSFEISGALKILEREIKELRERVSGKGRVEALMEELSMELNEIRKTIEERRSRIEAYKRHMESLNEVLPQLESGIKPALIALLGLDERWVSFKEKTDEIRKEMEKLINRKSKLELDRSERIDFVEKIKSGIAKCPICFSPIKKPERYLREHESAIKRIEGEISEVSLRIKELEDKLIKLAKSFLEEISRALRLEIERLGDELSDLEKREDEVKRRMDAKRELLTAFIKEEGRLRRLEASLSGFKRRADELGVLLPAEGKVELEVEEIDEYLMDKLTRLSELRGRVDGLIKDLKELNKAEKEELSRIKKKSLKEMDLEGASNALSKRQTLLSKLEEKRDEIISKLQELIGKISELRARIDERRKDLKRIEEMKDDLRRKREKLKELEKEAESLRIVEKKVFDAKGLPLTLLMGYLAEINEYANAYLRRFIEGLTIGIGVDEKTGNVEIDVFDENINARREIFTYSGGERTLIGFAVRLAISKVLATEMTERPSFLIIDEGFGQISEDLREALVRLISELSEDYEQVIVTSHVEDIRNSGVFQQEIRVIKENGISRIVPA